MKIDNNTPETERFLRKVKTWITRKCYLRTKSQESIHYEVDVNRNFSNMRGDVV